MALYTTKFVMVCERALQVRATR